MIEKILETFNLTIGKKQDLLTLLLHLEKNKIGIAEMIQYLEKLKKREIDFINTRNDEMKKTKERFNKMALRCPQCNAIMQLYSVNTQPGNQTGDNSKSVWFCPNMNCMETIYNKNSVQEIIKERRQNALS